MRSRSICPTCRTLPVEPIMYCSLPPSTTAYLPSMPTMEIPSGSKSFINPPNITTVTSNEVSCGDLVPEIGITSTPVIDQNTGTIYLVTKTNESGVYFQRLHAIDILTHAEKFSGPVVISASVNGQTFDPLRNNNRPGLLLENGHLVIAWASHCDNTPYHGWVMSYRAGVQPTDTLTQEAVFNGSPNRGLAGIWMSGDGVAAAWGSPPFWNGSIYWGGGNDGGSSAQHDEVQYAPGLFRYLKGGVVASRARNGQFLLTGSQKFTLMKSVSESTGRTSRCCRIGNTIFEGDSCGTAANHARSCHRARRVSGTTCQPRHRWDGFLQLLSGHLPGTRRSLARQRWQLAGFRALSARLLSPFRKLTQQSRSGARYRHRSLHREPLAVHTRVFRPDRFARTMVLEPHQVHRQKSQTLPGGYRPPLRAAEHPLRGSAPSSSWGRRHLGNICVCPVARTRAPCRTNR